MTNRFKRLDLIDRVPEELWTEVCDTVQEAGIKPVIPVSPTVAGGFFTIVPPGKTHVSPSVGYFVLDVLR